jgi:sugar porter (SP) family MFS transporter
MAIITSVDPIAGSQSAAIPEKRAYLWFIASAAALGGLLFGYDWVVIGGAAPFYEKLFRLVEAKDKGWAQSCALIGCLIGALGSGTLSDRFGRKLLLTISAIAFALSSGGIATSATFSVFVLWRILGGVAIGVASNLSPMYIAEIAPAAMRGKLVSLNQFTVVVGILLAQVVNLFIAQKLPGLVGGIDASTGAAAIQHWNETSGWRWMFGVTAIPSILFLLAMFVVPESPRWLLEKGNTKKGWNVLRKIGGDRYASQVVESIQHSIENEQKGGAEVRWFTSKRLLRILMLGIGLAVFQQWCGINVIFNYAAEIFKAAGYSIDDTLTNIAWTGSVNLVFTIVAMWLVDRLGRRPLMLIGSIALAVIYSLVGLCYFKGIHGGAVLGLVLGAIGFYAATLAPVTWVVISEIFPNRVRGKAMSISVFFLWTACFVLTYTFPLLNERFGPAKTFWVYAAICVAGFIMVLLALPETKGKSLEQIEKDLTE